LGVKRQDQPTEMLGGGVRPVGMSALMEALRWLVHHGERRAAVTVKQVVRWSRDHVPAPVAGVVRAAKRHTHVGSDGLTNDERARHAARYAATVGKTPQSSPERTERLRLLASKVEARPRRHPSAV
jgi:hypothetical protein